MTIYVHPDENRGDGYLKDPYFKLTIGTIKNNKGICRISISNPPRYIVHHDDKYKLNTTEKRDLCRIMQTKVDETTTIYDLLLKEIVKYFNNKTSYEKLLLLYPMPDFNLLK